MYTKEQVDQMLSQVEQEFENALGSIAKSEENIENDEIEVEAQESEELNKSENDEIEFEEEEAETIDELYASMSKNEKEAHYAAVKKSLFGEEVEEEVEEQSMEKSEESEESEDEVKMVKSENDELKAKNEELQKSLDTMNELVEKIFNRGKSAPKRKSITESYDVINKSEDDTEKEEKVDFSELSKNEITAKLKNIDYTELSKSDRTAINNYYLENGSVDSIKHLIRE